jgi:hypothetical protein
VVFFVTSDRTERASASGRVTPKKSKAPPERPPETAAPATAAPRTTTSIAFSSRPLGASVWREGETSGLPLGVTPFTAPFPISEETASFVFKLHGYKEAVASVGLAEDAPLEVELEKAGHAAGKKPAAGEAATGAATGPKKKLDVHETVDPFK